VKNYEMSGISPSNSTDMIGFWAVRHCMHSCSELTLDSVELWESNMASDLPPLHRLRANSGDIRTL
jgi:hypothetical protein